MVHFQHASNRTPAIGQSDHWRHYSVHGIKKRIAASSSSSSRSPSVLVKQQLSHELIAEGSPLAAHVTLKHDGQRRSTVIICEQLITNAAGDAAKSARVIWGTAASTCARNLMMGFRLVALLSSRIVKTVMHGPD